jgi:hypothetical protein
MQTDSAGLSIKHKTAGGTDSDNDGLFVKTVTITEKGACPTLPNNATNFLNGVGNWTIPPGSPLSDANPQDVTDTADPGEGTACSRDDHVHVLTLTTDAGLTWTGATLGINLNSAGGIICDEDGLAIKLLDPNSGLALSEDGLEVQVGDGLRFDDEEQIAVKVVDEGGIEISNDGLAIKAGTGIALTTYGVEFDGTDVVGENMSWEDGKLKASGGGGTPGSTVPNIISTTGSCGASTDYMRDDTVPGLYLVGAPGDGTSATYASLEFTTSNNGLQLKVKSGGGLVIDSDGVHVVWQAG